MRPVAFVRFLQQPVLINEGQTSLGLCGSRTVLTRGHPHRQRDLPVATMQASLTTRRCLTTSDAQRTLLNADPQLSRLKLLD